MPFRPAACAGPACVQRALHIVAIGLTHSSFVHFCDILWPEVQSDKSYMHLTAPCCACALGQARPTMQLVFS